MHWLGLNGVTTAWFRSYLTRSQVVKFNNALSDTKPVVTGMGQGTILGPPLFILYINDLLSVLHDLKVNTYADDCILYCSGNDWNRMISKIQPKFDKVQEWFATNRLKLNVKKSNSLIIGTVKL